MIAVTDGKGETSVSLADLGELRCVSAGTLPPFSVREWYSGNVCRLVIGDGVRFTADDEQIVLTTGEGLIVPPATLFSVATEESAATYVDFTDKEFCDMRAPVRVKSESCRTVTACVADTLGADARLRLTAAVLSVLGACTQVSHADNAVEGVKQYLDRFFYLPVCVEKLGESVGYSRGYFTAKFTREVGCSPYKYVTERRIRAAAQLLRGTDASVKTVAAVCGYTGVERFSEMFRRYTGFSPRAYRKEAKSDEK